jgi:predicted metal-binding membrane protein
MKSVFATSGAAHGRGNDLVAARPSAYLLLTMVIAGAWLIAAGAQATGYAALLHHHALVEDGPPLWVAAALFLLGWQVMIAAMMLPASLPSVGAFNASVARLARRRRALGAFLGAFVILWTIFGLLAFLGDVVLHLAVHEVPWLGARPWLIEGGVMALAGAYQLIPLKRRSLAACRHPASVLPIEPGHSGSFRLGLNHGLACLVSSWALMLLMFAEGFANLWWMAALAAVMVYETTGRHGQRAASAVGLLLLVLALVTFATGWGAM